MKALSRLFVLLLLIKFLVGCIHQNPELNIVEFKELEVHCHSLVEEDKVGAAVKVVTKWIDEASIEPNNALISACMLRSELYRMQNNEIFAHRDETSAIGLSAEYYLKTKDPLRLYFWGIVLSTFGKSDSEILAIKDIGEKMHPGFPAFTVSDSKFLSFCNGSAQMEIPAGDHISLPK